jgi:hypothetical protein
VGILGAAGDQAEPDDDAPVFHGDTPNSSVCRERGTTWLNPAKKGRGEPDHCKS